jgi:Uma2 family endonuclease
MARLVTVVTLLSAAGVLAEPWRRAYVDTLPDEAFAVVHVRRDGARSRHLPHHDADGRLDLPHLRSALARLGQVRWEDPADAGRARRHLEAHQETLRARRGSGPFHRRRALTLTAHARGPYNPGVSGERAILTYRDYEALPDDGRRYELHDGELSVTPAPGTRHQRISSALNSILKAHVAARGLGEVLYAPVDVVLSDSTIVQPDLVYLDPTRAHLVSERGIEGPPTLAVEIVSPSTTSIDRSTKRQLYRRFGVPHYWIVDPEARTVEAYRLAEGDYRLAARASGDTPVSLPPFPDLAFAPASLWP